MIKMNRSPLFWLVLGVLWTVTLVVHVWENGFVFLFSYVPFGLLAVTSYALAIYFAIKRICRNSRNKMDIQNDKA